MYSSYNLCKTILYKKIKLVASTQVMVHFTHSVNYISYCHNSITIAAPIHVNFTRYLSLNKF